MADYTSDDVTTFFVSFAVVWGGLAAYLVRLHLVQRRLARELDRLR